MNKKAIVMMLVLILLVSSLLLPSSINVKGKTNLYVDQNNPQYYGSITSAIENASTGDTIFVYDGIYYENLVIDKSLDLIGYDKTNTIIDGNGIGDVIEITADYVNISEFTIRNSGASRYGIYINSDYNIIRDNNLTNDEGTGIGLSDNASDNVIYHNNFIDNDINAIDYGIFNTWNDDYPSAGNYWDNYTGNDAYYGPYQDWPGEDDIGDSPYNITGGDGNKDYFPLMNPYETDLTPPEITSVSNSQDNLGYGFNITISANVTDSGRGIALVIVNVTYPNKVYQSFKMDFNGGITYEYVFSDTWWKGRYNYTQ